MKKYILKINWTESTTRISKEFPNDKEATQWMHNVLEMCGHNEMGEKYFSALLIKDVACVSTH